MDAASILALVQANRPEPFAPMVRPTRRHRHVPMAWDEIPGYVAAAALRRKATGAAEIETYVGCTEPGSDASVAVRYLVDLEFEKLEGEPRRPDVNVLAEHASRCEDGTWIGVAHLRLGPVVREVRADGRSISIGRAGIACVLWHGDQPDIEATMVDGTRMYAPFD